MSVKTLLMKKSMRVAAKGCCVLLLAIILFWCILRLSPRPPLMQDITFSRVILDRNGGLLRMGLTPDHKYRRLTRLEDIPPEAIASVIRYEDRYFWHHPGINVLSLFRAGLAMLSGGRIMGGSTITMQVARLSSGLKTGSLKDKLRQIWLALRLERHYSKARILEAYFNLAPYGGNVEGLGAAALVYFRKNASELTPDESLALMLVPQNPGRRSPASAGSDFHAAEQRLIREWYGRETARLRVHSPADMPFRCPHLVTEILAEPNAPGTVRTAIDLRLQGLLEKLLKDFVRLGRQSGLHNACALLVHWPTMEVRALAGSANFFDSSISGQIDGTLARRSPGSTLKPFIYALGLEQGLIHPMTLLRDLPKSFAGYTPENFDGDFRGPLPACEALRLSRNVPAITLASQLRNPDLYDFLRSCHVDFLRDRDHYGLSLVLGGAEVTPRELAALYCMLANRGIWKPLRLTLDEPQAAGQQRLSPEASFITLDMLVSDASDENIPSREGKNIHVRCKTGTSNGFRDAWTAGIAGPYVLVVWVGNFNNDPHPLFVGGRTAKPLFLAITRRLAASEAMSDMLSTPSRGTNLVRIPVCTATGDLDISLCQDTTETWFIPGVSPISPTGILRKILIDKKTGLRACTPQEGGTEEVPWEFWPSDLERMFRSAGINKPSPPPYLPECRGREGLSDGPAPSIELPRAGITYSLGTGGTVPLLANSASGADLLYWFADSRFIGTSLPGEVLLFSPQTRRTLIRVVDSAGRTSQRVLRTAPLP